MLGRRFLPLLTLPPIVVLCASIPAAEKVLYEKPSPYNTIFVTEDEQGLRTLRFERGGARQSVVKLGDPDHFELFYARTMLVGLAFIEFPERILVVGLGGGTIPMFLHRHYPEATIDAVDIDPDVVDVAKRFFGFREDDRMRAHVDDGRKFIERCERPYDIIFLDAFGTENVPYALATREFLQAVRRAVKPDGAVVGNIWGPESNRLYHSMVRTYQNAFRQLYVLDVKDRSNRILVAMPRMRSIERPRLTRRAETISKAQRFGFDMGDLVDDGFRGVEPPNTQGSVLTDAGRPESPE